MSRSTAAPAREGAGAVDSLPTAAVADLEASSARSDIGAPPDHIRAVFLGTSLTAGLGLIDDAERFTERIQTLADSAGMEVVVVNAGLSGDTSAGGVTRIDWILQEPLDVLVIELGANDGLRGLDVGAMTDNLREIITRTRTRYPSARVVLAGMEAPPNLGFSYTTEFREAFPTLAREEGVTLIPFLLEGVGGNPDLNQDDGIHPNAAGNEVIARNVWAILEPVLADALSGRG